MLHIIVLIIACESEKMDDFVEVITVEEYFLASSDDATLPSSNNVSTISSEPNNNTG